MPSKAIGDPRVTVPAAALEHREPAAPGGVDAAVEGGPVGRGGVPGRAAAVDRAVAERVGAIPELEPEAARRADDQVDLARGRGRDQHLVGEEPARQARQHQAVVGERAAVVDDPVDAAAEPAGIGEVERAVEGQRAIDHGQVVDVAADDVGQRELVVELRAGARARASRRSACRRFARAPDARRRPRSPCPAIVPVPPRRAPLATRGAAADRAVDQQPAGDNAGRRRCNRSPRSAWSCRCPAGPPRHVPLITPSNTSAFERSNTSVPSLATSPTTLPRRPPVAKPQRARRDRRAAGVDVVGRQRHRAGARHGQRAGAGERVRKTGRRSRHCRSCRRLPPA